MHIFSRRNNLNSIALKSSTEHDKEVEEFSDGISIISESSESVDRFSPHPLLREQLHNMLQEEPLPTLFTQSSIYSRIEPLDVVDTDEDQHTELRRRKPSVSLTDSALQESQENNKNELISTSMLSHPLIKRGVSALFYAAVTLALLSFMGRLRNPEWDVSSGKSLAEFEQKINNLELQHNLMIAEIDLLNKQVKYLTDLNAAASPAGKYETKAAKKFKAWSGNGRNLDAVEISKDDLKRPYKCGEDGKFVEIGGVCVDKATVSQENLVEEVGNIVNDMLQDSETYKSFEKVAEAFLNKGNEDEISTPTVATAQTAEDKFKTYASLNRKNEGPPKRTYFKKHSNERINDSNENDDDEDDSKENKYDRYKDNSKERYNKFKKTKGNSNNNSKERFDKRQRKQFSSEEHADKAKDPNWHEKLMQQREELRRQRHHNNANNWYIERGDSREQARNS